MTNTGLDNSTGHGNDQIAVINSNSGTTGEQALFQGNFTVGDDASITVQNTGTASGANTNGGLNVAGMNLGQLVFGDSTAPGAGAFLAGKGLNISVSNSGTDSENGIGGDAVADVSANQLTFYEPAAMGSNASITITNSGNYSGDSSTTFTNVGSVGGSQFETSSNFRAGDGFHLQVENTAVDSGTGAGDNFIGDVITGQQVNLGGSATFGNNATFLITNEGTSSDNSTTPSQAGSLMGYGKQLLVSGAFQAGNDFSLTMTNAGHSNGTGPGGFVGFFNNNTADNTASQAQFNNSFTVGDDAAITAQNTGTASGNKTGSGPIAGVLAGGQIFFLQGFVAGNGLNMSVTNSGTDSDTGVGGDSVGIIGLNQLHLGATAVMGNNATIAVSNSGVNSSTSTSNNVGYINGDQLLVADTFTAGQNLQLSVSNTASNTGNVSNSFGTVNASAEFQQAVSIGAGSLISASNSGTVNGSQLIFDQGFTVSSGKATIEATNTGAVAGNGITILGNGVGGNADIVLHNASLYVDTAGAFTIGGLSGDSTSTAQSSHDLIINTDATTIDTFAGVIQDFAATVSTLTKTGAGTQILSGANTYTGLTTVAGGMLILPGSVAGDVTVDSGATFSTGNTAGTSTVAGNLVNHGTVSVGIARTLSLGSLDTAPVDGTLAFAAGNTSGSLTTGHIDTTTTAADFSHQAISVNYSGGLLNATPSLIATGTGAAVAPAAAVADGSFLYDFSVAAGTGGTNNNLYLAAAMQPLAGLASSK